MCLPGRELKNVEVDFNKYVKILPILLGQALEGSLWSIEWPEIFIFLLGQSIQIELISPFPDSPQLNLLYPPPSQIYCIPLIKFKMN